MTYPTQFEWDETKAASNLQKHRLTFARAIEIFDDPERIDIDISRISDLETRRKVIGKIDGKLYIPVYTLRGNVCRIISARRTNRMEERLYGNRSI